MGSKQFFFILVIFFLGCSSIYAQEPTLITKKVFVLYFDPIIESEGNIRLHEVFMNGYKNHYWFNPHILVPEYINIIKDVSHNTVDYTIVQQIDIDDFPPKKNNLPTNEVDYLKCVRDSYDTGVYLPIGVTCDGSSLDYNKMLSQYNICEQVNSGVIDELWYFSGSYGGGLEVKYTGPNANLYYFGTPLTGTICNKLLSIMGFSYARSTPEMLHDFSHRVEGVMKGMVSAQWRNSQAGPWNQFVLYDQKSPGLANCGTVHFPPNGTSDYNYTNTTVVENTCEDWFNYPNLTGIKQSFACEKWGCTQLGYLKWWLSHLPHVVSQTNSIWNNWWKYVVDYESAISHRPVFMAETYCMGAKSQATFYWAKNENETLGYYVDLNDADNAWNAINGFWRSYAVAKDVLSTTAPNKFVNAYDITQLMSELNPTKTYYARVKYKSLGVYSDVIHFIPKVCPVSTSTPTKTPTQTQTPTSTPTSKPGDANGDGKVDGIDYVTWLNHYNQTVTGGPSVGDFNGSGKADGVDYVMWVNNYGK